jgi:hypothetical protein
LRQGIIYLGADDNGRPLANRRSHQRVDVSL